ncbi:MBOAT family O-acyltransferase [Leptospira sp. GIMC2001]|uniref:MBOAT family O-acyltransferase n=1 Tax=Leptospira sp. GIMC2001 TaxID=1513297 RepID=UPI0023499D4E|nr:MBOAT family O-acyltransferase [Leptospira sp. GIMC2001]WCL47637.1 MBOAT family protein [Leptospira sp. GIMC2001]
MLFNSTQFLIFFVVVLIIGNILKNKTWKIFLLAASCIFYMGWHPATISCSAFRTGSSLEFWIDKLFCEYHINAYIIILFASTIVDFFAARLMNRINEPTSRRRIYLIASLLTNIGILAYFKYTNFLIGVVNDVFLNSESVISNVDIILPVGISFYTFQSMSYSIDVYNRRIEPRKSFLDFCMYIAFFPQLVAGPIVRAETFFRDLDNRLPVLKENIEAGFSLILIGFTRKIVFADNLAKVVDYTFANYMTMNPLEIWTGVIAFGWQIYFDFAGYTDIAIGVARLFGFQFDANFNFPMAVKNIGEHWSKWHISFSTWIRDYIFIPLGGSKGSPFLTYRNLYITWLFAGLWHGAAYHYIGWGIWQAVMLTGFREYSRSEIATKINEKGGLAYDLFCRIFTMFCLGFGFAMFRAETLTKATEIMKAMLFIGDSPNAINSYDNYHYGILLIICYTASYYFSKRKIAWVTEHKKPWIFPAFIIANVMMILIFGVTESQNFLYFAF